MYRFSFHALLGILAVAFAGVFAGAGRAAELRVATFQSDATPPLGHPNYTLKPLATVEHPLLAKGIVLEDGDRRYVLCAVDWCVLSNSSHLMFRRKIAEAAETEVSRTAVQTVHVHTAPIFDGAVLEILKDVKDPPRYFDPEVFADIVDRAARAVKQACKRLEPFDSIGTGQAKVEKVASSRRIPVGDGKFRWRMSSTKGRPELRELPEGYIDPYLKTVTFAREERPLVRLHYYATHPQSFYGDARASYDFAGMAREALQKKEGVFQVYFTGCAGDVAAGKYNDRSPRARDELAGRLLAGMEASIAATRFVAAERPEWRTVPVLLPTRTDPGHTRADYFAKVADTKTKPMMRVWYARRMAFGERGKTPIDLSSLRIGRVFILHLPGEPMVEYQLFAQRSKPDHFVAVAGYGEGCTSYICTEQAFSEGGYEPRASAVAPASEKILKGAIRRLLGSE